MNSEQSRAKRAQLPWICATVTLNDSLELLDKVDRMPGGRARILAEWTDYKRTFCDAPVGRGRGPAAAVAVAAACSGMLC